MEEILNKNSILSLALEKLSVEFNDLDLTLRPMEGGSPDDLIINWPGPADDDAMICVFNGTQMMERFHRQDFFFLNYAYQGSYQALSSKYNNLITINEDECYIGQPYSGYALRGSGSGQNITVIGVLIRRDSFFRNYLPVVNSDSRLLHFFIEPQTNKFSDEFIHLSVTKEHPIRTLLELMVMEYADRREDTQRMLKTMLQTLILEISRRSRIERLTPRTRTIPEKILDYISENANTVTLKDVADRFSYHPSYVSALLRRETGHKFTDIVLAKRMEQAVLLLRNTPLSVEEIAAMLGYGNQSNFYKAFRKYYGTAPRDYLNLNLKTDGTSDE